MRDGDTQMNIKVKIKANTKIGKIV